MNKNTLIIALISILLTIWWCNTENQNWAQNNSEKLDNQSTNKSSYIVKWNEKSTQNVYWIIKSENTKNITNNIWWIVKQLNCQIWAKVKQNDIIATIEPDSSDPNYKTLLVQKTSLNEQLTNISNMIQSTITNYDSQINQLEQQKSNNEIQINILNKNISNLEKQKENSSSDIQIQISNLEQQIANFEKQKELSSNEINSNKENLTAQINKLTESLKLVNANKTKSLETIENDIENLVEQTKNYIEWWFEYVDQIYWITDKNQKSNDSYENLLSAKDTSIKTELEQKFKKLNNQFWNYNELDNENLIEYLDSLAELFDLAKDWILKSVADSNYFSQTSIDKHYKEIGSMESAVLTYKWNLTKLLNSYETTLLTFDNQISTINLNKTNLEKNLENLENNKWEISNTSYDNNISILRSQLESLKNNQKDSSNLNYESNINSLKSQLQNLETSSNKIDNQILSLKETKQSQIKQLENQKLTINQNINSININLSWETIKAGIEWTIKSKNVEQWNKIPAYSNICEINPDSWNSVKLVIYSPEKIDLWTTIIWTHNNQSLSWTILYESPEKDEETQNFIYESELISWNYNIWEKINIKFEKNLWNESNQSWVRIPVKFVTPKLDWYYVKKLSGNNEIESLVKIWELSNDLIEITEWLKVWDEIIK